MNIQDEVELLYDLYYGDCLFDIKDIIMEQCERNSIDIHNIDIYLLKQLIDKYSSIKEVIYEDLNNNYVEENPEYENDYEYDRSQLSDLQNIDCDEYYKKQDDY